jgi:hypothetical protein
MRDFNYFRSLHGRFVWNDSCQTLIISVVYTDDLFGRLMPDFDYFRSLHGLFHGQPDYLFG